jgi:hypothetical protein
MVTQSGYTALQLSHVLIYRAKQVPRPRESIKGKDSLRP